ncbi:branched-chain-amino-acid aminotransferase [Lentilactobacillus fungorum]|uniref:Branched-chain-amino-acid aminotransferase n=1 Tax=Lentilactobacillus fungorum TaxID=2201250 RepID=A0ABQ3W1F5_9LACO|nr:branched-chain amino acid aminotransferase [Lentilactobacillus fungorum]GHP15018.1 branched-chain-amino-acid aminotransferase [Lentilactobacillus fungorum]
MAKQDIKDLDWNNLGFEYRDLPYRYTEDYKDGKWQGGELTTDSTITLSEGAEELHYGQEVFEGMKAYRTKDGGINLFRPDMNAKRLNNSAKRLVMPSYPEDKYVDAVKQVVKANQDFVPPYGSGGSLYIRPFMIGTEPVVGVKPSSTYTFRIYATPVGAYIKGLQPMPYVVSDYDRAAHAGTGQAKTAGNYAASLLAGTQAHEAGYAGELYLDPREHKYIDEFSGANFYGIGKDGKFYTPKSESILPSITKKSILTIAKDLDLDPQETHIDINDLDQFTEAGAMGTAAVISPVGSLTYKGNKHVFYSETKPGPVTQKLYDTLYGIQEGDVEDKYGWVVKVDL